MHAAVRRSARLGSPLISTPARAGPSRLSPPSRYVSSSTYRPAPATQYSQEVDNHLPPHLIQGNTTAEAVPSQFAWRRPLIYLPPPIPDDAYQEADPLQRAFYPTSRLLESVSMISMCLRRKEHIPRAYQIFQTILKDLDSGSSGIPDAQVFGKVAEGIGSLAEGVDIELWKSRTMAIVRRWETLHGSDPDVPYLGQGGLKVYAGWVTGCIRSNYSLDDFTPYLASEEMPVEDLIAAVPIEHREQVLIRLLDLARKNDLRRTAETMQGILDEFQGVSDDKDPVPELTPVKQNAYRAPDAERETPRHEVTSLRRTLNSIDDVRDPVKRQYRLESMAYHSVKDDLQSSADSMAPSLVRDLKLKSPQLQSWMYKWVELLQSHLESEIKDMAVRVANGEKSSERRRPGGAHRRTVAEHELLLYLQLLPADRVALIAVTEVMRLVGMGFGPAGTKAITLMVGIGKGVEAEFQAEMIRSNFGSESKTWLNLQEQMRTQNRQAIAKKWEFIGKKMQEDGVDGLYSTFKDIWSPKWPVKAHVDLGGYLLNHVVNIAKVMRSSVDPATGEEVIEEQQAFSHGYEYIRGHKLGIIQTNPVIMDRLSTDKIMALLPPKYLPMLVPPRPWQDHSEGGYLFHNTPVMRHKESVEQAEYLKAAIRRRDVEPVLQGLDVLSSTPWTVNKQVYDVVYQVWQSGERLAAIPPSEGAGANQRPEPPKTNDPAAKASYMLDLQAAVLQERKDHAERCRINYALEVASKFQGETFYLPHNVDFRGRAYPIPPHLSPVGDDLNRGLLKFAKKKALGETGLKWLRIHCSNLYGFDKASFAERVKFAEDHEADIFDSAERPLEGKRWWLKAEDPWQCLATCFELHAALKSPDPTAFESSIPVHQDGTCNGMQHYAALGGDVRGAKAVNLENGDRPADIYTRVVEIVNHVIDQDKAAGNKVALLISEPLSRKIVKQTVMTTVYGVTFIGARDQIAKQLIERTDVARDRVYDVSAYIAKVVLSCIGDLFSGAKDIQDWLTSSARLISRSIPPNRLEQAAKRHNSRSKDGLNLQRKEMMSSVIWTTPLNLPIVQPYRKPKAKQVMTALQSVYVTDPTQAMEVSAQKQASAFPPNFVHSLDATHMFLTALACDRAGISFASVHDSYWTHAATVEGMADLIRDAFISLHSQDLIGELRKEFLLRYGESYVLLKDARTLHQNVLKRRIEEDRRRAKVRAAMEKINTRSDDKKAASMSKDEQMIKEVVTAAQDVMEQGELKLAEPASEVDPDLSHSDQDSIVIEGVSEWEQTIKPGIKEIDGQVYVQFKYLLWEAPRRGLFDVTRIKESAYFFS